MARQLVEIDYSKSIDELGLLERKKFVHRESTGRRKQIVYHEAISAVGTRGRKAAFSRTRPRVRMVAALICPVTLASVSKMSGMVSTASSMTTPSTGIPAADENGNHAIPGAGTAAVWDSSRAQAEYDFRNDEHHDGFRSKRDPIHVSQEQQLDGIRHYGAHPKQGNTQRQDEIRGGRGEAHVSAATCDERRQCRE